MASVSRPPRDVPVTVHVGYHKTGTSWLQRAYLPIHPEVQVVGDSVDPANDPFLGYLVGSNDWTFDPDHAWALFAEQAEADGRHLVVSAERLSGHPFSGGFDQVRLARRIRSTLPGARVVVVVRDQVAMLESVYRQLVESGYPGSFASLIGGHGWTTPWFDPVMYEYDVVLEHYRRIFGEDGVLMLRYEQLDRDPDAFVRALCAFMHVRFVPGPRQRVNRTVSAEFLLVTRLLNRFRRTERNRWPVVPLPAKAVGALSAKLGRLLPASARNLVTDEERAWIEGRYAASNARLTSMIEPTA